jgi:hypothetical protein
MIFLLMVFTPCSTSFFRCFWGTCSIPLENGWLVLEGAEVAGLKERVSYMVWLRDFWIRATDGGRGNRAFTEQLWVPRKAVFKADIGLCAGNGCRCPYEQCLSLTSPNLHNSHCWPLKWLLLGLSTTPGSIHALPLSPICSSDWPLVP